MDELLCFNCDNNLIHPPPLFFSFFFVLFSLFFSFSCFSNEVYYANYDKRYEYPRGLEKICNNKELCCCNVTAGQKVCLFMLLECIVDTRGYFRYFRYFTFDIFLRLTSDSASKKSSLRALNPFLASDTAYDIPMISNGYPMIIL